MSKRTVALIATVVAFAISAVPAAAANDNHTQPGTPEANNCSGQSVAFLAQLGAEAGIHGLAGVADAVGFSVQQVHELIDEYCAS